MLNVVLVIAHFTVWECPNGNDRKNEKGNYNTKNCHGRIFLTIKFRSTNYIICKINLKNCKLVNLLYLRRVITHKNSDFQ